MMTHDYSSDPILAFWDELMALALARTNGHRQDAEDLVSETLLAAYAYLHGGGVIEHPRTWLMGTLRHKHADLLRRRYRTQGTVSLDELPELADGEEAAREAAFAATEEAAEVRRAICYLGELHREVLVRFYYRGESVQAIASALGIPEGTVKSRLSDGRRRVSAHITDTYERKQPMDKQPVKNALQGHLFISWSGSVQEKSDPFTPIQDDLIAQNLLLHAYERPKPLTELADALGIPTVYLEPIARRLVSAQLMAETERGLLYTDFIIYHPDPDRSLAALAAIKAMIESHWDALASVIERLTADVGTLAASLPPERRLSTDSLRRLERFALLHALQRYERTEQEAAGWTMTPSPQRPDGGRWTAMGWAHPGDRAPDPREATLADYNLVGGLRTTPGVASPADPAAHLTLCEFDTPFWDHPRRFMCVRDLETYFSHMPAFLWHLLHTDEGDACAAFPNELLEGVPALTEAGMLRREGGHLRPAIPILSGAEFDRLSNTVASAVEALHPILGANLHAHLKGAAVWVPPHLNDTSVPPLFRIRGATECFVMAVVRRAHAAGIHMQGVEACCPPAVLCFRS